MHFKTCTALLALLLSVSAWALDAEPFSNERFAELQGKGELVLIDIFATWCPTCARQHEVLKKYQAEHPEVDLHILTVDYDEDRQTVRQLRAPRQSTLLLYKGDKQFWYSVAETREDVIFDAINRAANFE
jgi:thioredoxin 1